MRTPISRRRLIAASPLALAGCGRDSDYFGETAPPAGQNLAFALGPEPESLDPAQLGGGFELYILPARWSDGRMVNAHDTNWRPQ